MRKIYDTLSFVLSPLLIELYIVIAFSVFSPIGLGSLNVFSSLAIGLTFIFFIPSFLVYYSSRGQLEISQRGERNKLYPMVILSFLASSVIFWFSDTHIMFMISLAYFLVTLVCYAINLFWKISTHSAGVAGPVTALVYVFGLWFAPLFIFLIPVFWARIKLKAHTPLQLIAGIVVAILITSVIYSLLW
jgi:membrane-associated phospholipid phosphatase